METMPIEAKVATVTSDLIKFVEISARDYGLPPLIISGILAQILVDWKNKELVQVNDGYSTVITTMQKVAKEDKKDVQS